MFGHLAHASAARLAISRAYHIVHAGQRSTTHPLHHLSSTSANTKTGTSSGATLPGTPQSTIAPPIFSPVENVTLQRRGPPNPQTNLWSAGGARTRPCWPRPLTPHRPRTWTACPPIPNHTPPSAPAPCVRSNSHTSFSSCSQVLLRSLPVCSWSVAVKNLSLPDGSFSS